MFGEFLNLDATDLTQSEGDNHSQGNGYMPNSWSELAGTNYAAAEADGGAEGIKSDGVGDADETKEAEAGGKEALDESKDAESEIALDSDEAGDVSDVRQEEPIFKHSISYRAGRRDHEFVIEYDKHGNITPKSMAALRDVLSKTHGLEMRTQQAVEKLKHLERALEAERINATQWKQKYRQFEEAYAPVISFLRDNPQITSGLRQTFKMPELPDYERLKAEMELQELRAQVEMHKARDFVVEFANELRGKHPDITDEQLNAIGAELQTMNLGSIFQGKSYEEIRTPLLGLADGIIARMRLEGRLSNPAVEKVLKSKKEVEKKLQIHKQRAAIQNPLAGAAIGSAGAHGEEISWEEARRDPMALRKLIESRLSGGKRK